MGNQIIETMNPTLSLLLKRRSALVNKMTEPGPDEAQLNVLLSIAARVPDHGKLAPWRFIVIEGDARFRMGEAITQNNKTDLKEGLTEETSKDPTYFAHAPLIITVVSKPVPHPKIPIIEQEMSAAACCSMLLVAAAAMGFDSRWVTGWAAQDPRILQFLGVNSDEKVIGFIYIGTAREKLEDRQRPALADIVTRL